ACSQPLKIALISWTIRRASRSAVLGTKLLSTYWQSSLQLHLLHGLLDCAGLLWNPRHLGTLVCFCTLSASELLEKTG
ncbi:MAG: hypothetical protein QXU62_02890, partial [Thermofilaceae archaeon]